MAEGTVHLLPGKFYHIYNHGNGDENLFLQESNYAYFLGKYSEYISPVADTYAYCLMPNHFHFLIRIKSEETLYHFLKETGKLPEENITMEEFEALLKMTPGLNPYSLHISRQFSNFFNGYSQAINKQESRKGSLFVRTFKRKEITSTDYLRSVIQYIHLNPVHHQFVEKISDWKHVSYHSIVSEMATRIKRKEVIDLFEDLANFKFSHTQMNNQRLLEIEEQLN